MRFASLVVEVSEYLQMDRDAAITFRKTPTTDAARICVVAD